MIDKPTTIVLGAGASMPYGFPSGEGLRKNICRSIGLRSFLPRSLHNLYGISPDETVEFIKAFLYSGVSSIDSFLSKNSRYVKIGKLCIAVDLCTKENFQNVVNIDNEDHWYQILWNELIVGATTANDLLRNKISFVTFNYDRSLEYFIYLSIKNTFDTTDEEALRVLNEFKILHVYGELGKFHYKPQQGSRAYVDDLDSVQIEIAANAIKVIPEVERDSDSFHIARKYFEDYKMIGFLGFGFDALNVERLGLSVVLHYREKNKVGMPTIMASVLKKTPTERAKITRFINPSNMCALQLLDEENTRAIRMSSLLG